MGILRADHLGKEYVDGNRRLSILNGVSCDFSEGVSYGIVGRSGVGKSTFLHLLAGLDSPTSGTVTLGERVLSSLSPDERSRIRAERIGFIFQAHHLLPEFTARENVAMPLLIAGRGDDEALARSDEALNSVGLQERGEHLPSMLSGGEQQRVAIARAIVAQPSIILADEPTGSLDVETASSVQALLVGIQKQRKVTLIVVTHSSDFARQMDVVWEMGVGGSLHPLRDS